MSEPPGLLHVFFFGGEVPCLERFPHPFPCEDFYYFFGGGHFPSFSREFGAGQKQAFCLEEFPSFVRIGFSWEINRLS